MATPTQKKVIIDNLNSAFIEQGIKSNTRDYEKFFDKTISRSLGLLPKDNVTNKDLRRVVNGININKSSYLRQTYNMTVLSGLTNIIENQRIKLEDRALLLPLLLILSRYPTTKPVTLALKIDKVTKAILSNKISTLSGTEKAIAPSLRKYYNSNSTFIKEQLAINRKKIVKIHREIKSNVSKTILKTLKSEIIERITIVTDDKFKDIKRPKTFKEIRESMRSKFGKQIDYRVRRIVDTELHDLAENTKHNQHLMMGYTHKKWNTQGDSLVRDETQANHKALNSVTIPVKNKFKMVGKAGGRALYPSDPSLPPSQRINCRCFLTYVKR